MLNRLLQMKNRSQLQLSGERDWDILQLIVCRHLLLRGLLQHWDWAQLQLRRKSGVDTAGDQEQLAAAAIGPGTSTAQDQWVAIHLVQGTAAGWAMKMDGAWLQLKLGG